MLNGCLAPRVIYFPLRSYQDYQYSRITVKIALHSRAGLFIEIVSTVGLNIQQSRSQSCVVKLMRKLLMSLHGVLSFAYV